MAQALARTFRGDEIPRASRPLPGPPPRLRGPPLVRWSAVRWVIPVGPDRARLRTPRRTSRGLLTRVCSPFEWSTPTYRNPRV